MLTTQPAAPSPHEWAAPADTHSGIVRGRWLWVARLAWLGAAGLALVVFMGAVPLFYQTLQQPYSPGTQVPGQLTSADADLLARWGISLGAYAAYQTGLVAFFALVFMAAGVVLFWLRSNHRVALLVSLWLVLLGVTGSPLVDPLLRDAPAWEGVVRFLQGAAIGGFPIITYLFPDGRFRPRWTAILAAAWLTWIVIAPFTPFTVANFSGASLLWFGVLLPVSMGIGLIAQIYRYRYISSPTERLQTRWVLLGFGAIILGFLSYGLVPMLFPFLGAPTLARVLYLNLAETVLLVIPWFALLACVVIAVLRYRLYDFDIVVNRTLVYGTLSVGVLGLYLMLVSVLGALFNFSGNLWLVVLATALVALLVQPARMHLQQRVNRLMYGERDDPYMVLSRLSHQLKETLGSDEILPAITATVVQTLKLPYVALVIHSGEQQGIGASTGVPPAGSPANLLALPVNFQAETVGQMLVAPRAPGEEFTPTENKLLSQIALQAGAAVHAVRLAAELKRSHERLLSAREEERRRLRRDLHDGLGPQLASIALTIAAVREVLPRDPQAADRLLQELGNHAQGAIVDTRRIVNNLRPPALDARGLVQALRDQASVYAQSGLHIEVEAPDSMPSLPAQVELAAFHIAQEAMINVVRHARAHNCVVQITLDDALALEIRDDGQGLIQNRQSGFGLHSIRERTEELGGTIVIASEPATAQAQGTTIRVRLPLKEDAA